MFEYYQKHKKFYNLYLFLIVGFVAQCDEFIKKGTMTEDKMIHCTLILIVILFIGLSVIRWILKKVGQLMFRTAKASE